MADNEFTKKAQKGNKFIDVAQVVFNAMKIACPSHNTGKMYLKGNLNKPEGCQHYSRKNSKDDWFSPCNTEKCPLLKEIQGVL